ncbi:MAG: phosphate transport system regulatory protein PhoU, partial [Actinomycetota bacterium]|nr:phosphate transport system regulatory protein PhoU [Actinomycetota bacterium]
MRESFHAELDSLISDLAKAARLAGQMMANASTALSQGDLALAELVLSSESETKALCDDMDQRCVKLLVLQAPVATDLRVVVAAMHAVRDVERMWSLAQHIAKIARLRHPAVPIPDDVRPVFARMGMLATSLAQDAATAIEQRDPMSAQRLAQADDEVDALRRRIFQILFAEDWVHGV